VKEAIYALMALAVTGLSRVAAAQHGHAPFDPTYPYPSVDVSFNVISYGGKCLDFGPRRQARRFTFTGAMAPRAKKCGCRK
jgi:hypothetical protein